MSGEGSSSGTSRKRRASTRSQGAVEEQPADVPLREIRYHGPRILDGQSTVLQDCPLSQFADQTAEFLRYHVLSAVKLLEFRRIVKLLEFRRIDWELVGRLGQVDRLQQLLGEKFRLVLDCDAPQYYELALEFHSTFQYIHVGGLMRRMSYHLLWERRYLI
ncbi:hypothetical protein HanPI659440_Chr04g0165901 [Helianthus annuus]|nr:hypothetical protein HanPI659440_Chr04g0165901 [Helianthus annuus]